MPGIVKGSSSRRSSCIFIFGVRFDDANEINHMEICINQISPAKAALQELCVMQCMSMGTGVGGLECECECEHNGNEGNERLK